MIMPEFIAIALKFVVGVAADSMHLTWPLIAVRRAFSVGSYALISMSLLGLAALPSGQSQPKLASACILCMACGLCLNAVGVKVLPQYGLYEPPK